MENMKGDGNGGGVQLCPVGFWAAGMKGDLFIRYSFNETLSSALFIDGIGVGGSDPKFLALVCVMAEKNKSIYQFLGTAACNRKDSNPRASGKRTEARNHPDQSFWDNNFKQANLLHGKSPCVCTDCKILPCTGDRSCTVMVPYLIGEIGLGNVEIMVFSHAGAGDVHISQQTGIDKNKWGTRVGYWTRSGRSLDQYTADRDRLFVWMWDHEYNVVDGVKSLTVNDLFHDYQLPERLNWSFKKEIISNQFNVDAFLLQEGIELESLGIQLVPCTNGLLFAPLDKKSASGKDKNQLLKFQMKINDQFKKWCKNIQTGP
ncbi:MAG: hypothetical protein GY862_05725 [Gammaproteobacteria bacterium]|nr:hypothetical protein [Gammaproteobacteria bacterium]